MRKATSKSHWNVRESVEDQFITGKLHFLCLITNIIEQFVQPKDSVFIHQSEASPKEITGISCKNNIDACKTGKPLSNKVNCQILEKMNLGIAVESAIES